MLVETTLTKARIAERQEWWPGERVQESVDVVQVQLPNPNAPEGAA